MKSLVEINSKISKLQKQDIELGSMDLFDSPSKEDKRSAKELKVLLWAGIYLNQIHLKNI